MVHYDVSNPFEKRRGGHLAGLLIRIRQLATIE